MAKNKSQALVHFVDFIEVPARSRSTNIV